MESEAELRVRAEKAEKSLAQAEARLASMAAKRQSGINRPLEKAIVKLLLVAARSEHHVPQLDARQRRREALRPVSG
eukprot:3007211-Prymnesium_polylepis.1